MIRTTIAVLDAASAGLVVATRQGYVEQVTLDGKTFPVKYTGGKDVKNVATDLDGTFNYWRLTSPITSRGVQGPRRELDQEVSFTLRMVALVDRGGPCADAASVMAGVQNNVQGNTLAVRNALNAVDATVDSVVVELDSAAVYAQELTGGEGRLPVDRQMVAMDVRITVRAKAGCLPSCVDPVIVDVATLNL